MPLFFISVSWLSLQLSLLRMSERSARRNSRVGSARGLGTPNFESEGPMPRTITFLGAFPVIINSAMPTLSPVCANRRVERFTASVAGVGVGVGVAVGVAVGVGDGGGVG